VAKSRFLASLRITAREFSLEAVARLIVLEPDVLATSGTAMLCPYEEGPRAPLLADCELVVRQKAPTTVRGRYSYRCFQT
jgi:hypothetical protein